MVNYRILWIDDDALMIMGLVRPLIRDGCQVDTALDVEKAKKLLKERKYDLVILDIILPSGKELQSEDDVKNIDRFYGLRFLESLPIEFPPILVLSVINEKEEIEKIRKFPQVKDVLAKGMIKPSELKEKVMSIIMKKT